MLAVYSGGRANVVGLVGLFAIGLGVLLGMLSLFGFGRPANQPYKTPWVTLSFGCMMLLVVGLGAISVVLRGKAQADAPAAGNLPQHNDPETKGGWVQVTSAEGHFTSWFPHEPKHTLHSGDLVHQYVAATKNGTVAFLVRYTPQVNTTVSLDERLATIKTVMKSTNAKIIPVTICDYPAKEMSHEYAHGGQRHSSRQRIVYARGDMYQLIVVAPLAEGIPEEDAQHFYAGFQLLAP
jgi:hypothetical protein